MFLRALLLWIFPLIQAVLFTNTPLSPLVDTATLVLLRSFQDPFASMWIAQEASNIEGERLLGDLLDAIIARLSGSIPVRFNVSLNGIQQRPWIRNVLLVDGYEAFRKLYIGLSVEQNDFSGRYLIVINSAVDEMIARRMFEDLWKLQVVNVVIVGLGEEEALLWSYKPYSSGSCGRVRLVKLQLIDEFYPDKTENFYGCPFKVGSFETRPFTIMDHSVAGELRMSGFEGDLLDTLKEKLNYSTKIYEPENGEQWGYALENNSTGMMRMIQEGEVDFGISCLGISVARNNILKAGIAHYTTALVLAVPKGRPYTALEKLFHPFDAELWWCIVGILLGATLVITRIEFANPSVRDFVYGRRIRTPYLNLFRVFFAEGMAILPTRNFSRTLLFFWIYFCYLLQSLYQGALFRYLQEDSTLPPSKTMAEIDRTDAQYYVVESAERYYEAFPHRYRRVRQLSQEKNNIIHRLEWMIQHPESPDVVMGALDHMAHHNHLYRRKGGAVDVCREFVSTYTVAIYYPKGSMLTHRFDEEISKIQASGLMSYWINRYGDYDFFRTVKEGSEPKPLSWEHVSAVYEICGVLLGLSGAVFGLELASVRYSRVRKLLRARR